MKVAVLDYTTGCLDVFEVDKGYENFVERFLTEEKGYPQDLEDIHWMEVKTINMHIGV